MGVGGGPVLALKKFGRISCEEGGRKSNMSMGDLVSLPFSGSKLLSLR